MGQDTLLNLLGIIGILLAPSAFIEEVSPYIKYPSFIAGIIAVGFYAKLYYDEKIIKLYSRTKFIIHLLSVRNKQMTDLCLNFCVICYNRTKQKRHSTE